MPEVKRTNKGKKAYENDLYYYYVVNQDDYENGIFNGNHYGYANDSIIKIFEEN